PPTSPPCPYTTLFRSDPRHPPFFGGDLGRHTRVRGSAGSAQSLTSTTARVRLPRLRSVQRPCMRCPLASCSSASETRTLLTYRRSEEHTSELQSRENL